MMWKSKQNNIFLCIVESDFTATLYDFTDVFNHHNTNITESANASLSNPDINSSLDDTYSHYKKSDYKKPIYSGDLTHVLDYCWQNRYLVNLRFSSNAIYLVTKLVPSTVQQHDRASWEQYQTLELFPEEEYVKVIGSGLNKQNIKQAFTTWISFGPIKNIIAKYKKCINSVSSRALDLYSQLSKVLDTHSSDMKQEDLKQKKIKSQDGNDIFSIKSAIVVFALEQEFVCIGAVSGYPITVRTFSKKSLDIREDIEETIAYAKQFDNDQELREKDASYNVHYNKGLEFRGEQSTRKTTRSLSNDENSNSVDKIILVNFSQAEKSLWEQFSFSLPTHFSDIGLDTIESAQIQHTDSAQAINTNQRFIHLFMSAINVFCIMIIGYYWIENNSLSSAKEKLQVLHSQNTKTRKEITDELQGNIALEHIQQMSSYRDVFSKSFKNLSMLQSFASQGESITKEIIYSQDFSGFSSFKLVLHVIKPQSYELLIQTHSRLRNVLEMIFKDMQIKLESDGQIHDSYMSYVAFISNNMSNSENA